MSNPVVSIYIPAIRPFLWDRVYESLTKNSVSFEVIFIGNMPPTFTLPENVYHINTPVKPAQCAEIGFRACRGEFCIYSHDDVFFGEGTLDLLLDCWHGMGTEMVVVSCMPYVCGKKIPTKQYLFWDSVVGSPEVPIGGLYKRSVLKTVGSRDRNFIASYSDLDLAMRFYEIGGRNVFCEGTIANEDYGFHDPNRLIWTGLKYDRPLLDQLWTITHAEYRPDIPVHYVNSKIPNGVVLKHRARPVEPFVDENLLTVSQGPKGRWT